MRISLLPCLLLAAGGLAHSGWSQALEPLRITNIVVNGTEKTLEWNLLPAADQYTVLTGFNLQSLVFSDSSGTIEGNKFTLNSGAASRFWQVRAVTLSSNELLSANILNRVAYGPTPDDLEYIQAIGPEAYLQEQLNPETLPAIDDAYTAVVTNGVGTVTVNPNTNWVSITVTGRVSSSRIYIYLRDAGSMYLDDVELRLLNDGSLGPNVINNGGFELSLAGTWNVSANLAGSSVSPQVAASGNSSLHMVSTSEGTTRTSSIWQEISPSLPTADNQECVLSFKVLPGPDSHLLTIRLSGSGTVAVPAIPQEQTLEWIYVTETGQAGGNPRMYVYIDGSGEAWLDNMVLVEGTVPQAGPNLLQNGGFESPMLGSWIATGNHGGSYRDNTISFEGNASVRVVSTGNGGSDENSFQQDPIPGLENGDTYTLSYWYRPATQGRKLTVRLSGSQLLSEPDESLAGSRRRLDRGEAQLEDLRAWFVRSAVGSKQQLLQILLQFLENHFVTQQSKSRDYLDGRGFRSGDLRDQIATDWEFREIQKWRECLLRPDCTFYDLLKISAESPAMIVYLDTVESRADGNRIANENFARELYELFCMGVDNGYDQNDIVAMSRAWTGWRVEIVAEEDIDNPFAQQSKKYGAYPGNNTGSLTNLIGVWTFNYQPQYHGPMRAPILSLWDPAGSAEDPVAIGPKRVPQRFGPPWALQPYQLNIPARTGTDSIQDGYDVLKHLADLPFTMEYISTKLCRLFIHDRFQHGVYDYTDPNLSPEAALILECMQTWDSTNPKGQIRPLLQTIFASDLFRSHGGSMQKVKTPLEFAVSAIRGLRAELPDGTFTASTDGYDISGSSSSASSAPLTRMGTMLLFDRADPDGYPEDGPPWISAGTLAERLRFVQSYLIASGESGKGDGGNNNLSDPVALLKEKLPSENWNNASAIVAYFIRTLFPGEGLGNLNQVQSLAVNYLNTDENGSPSSLWDLSNTSEAYDERVRGMVALLMSTPRFQEQ